MQPLSYVGLVAAAVQLGYGFDKLVVEDQSRCAAVFQNKLKFVCHQAPVQRHDHRADLRQRVVAFHEFARIH